MHEDPLHLGEHPDAPDFLLRKSVREKLCPTPISPYAFILDLETGELRFAGAAPSVAQQREIREAVLADLPRYERDFGYRTITRTSGATPLSLVYQVKWRMGGTKAAVYGIEFCVLSMAGRAFETVMAKSAVLPPALTKGVRNDSLFSVVVRDFEGNLLYRSPIQYPSSYAAEHALDAYGGLRTTIAINPAIADRLLIGGRPRSRLWLLVRSLGLTGVLVAIGCSSCAASRSWRGCARISSPACRTSCGLRSRRSACSPRRSGSGGSGRRASARARSRSSIRKRAA
jgi:hypothetical protein